MRNLKNTTVNFILLISLSSCVLRPTVLRSDEIPLGEHCILLRNSGFCVNDATKEQYNKSLRKMRGFECVNINYKKDLEFFIYDILEENAKLRQLCGSDCEGI